MNGDPGRIAAQVLTGIGFLGAGAIIQSHIQRVVYGASDTRWMSLDKLIHLPDPKLNYIPMIQSDILKDKCSKLIKDYLKRNVKRYDYSYLFFVYNVGDRS